MEKSLRRRNLFMSTTIMCLLLAVASTFDKQGILWLWSDKPYVAIALLVLAIILGSFWLRSQKQLHVDQK